MSQADRRYRPDIDGLRAVAVGVVMLFHAFPTKLPGGFVGVDVFFVISGYLISGIILGAHADGRFTFANFYARRIRRIFPALAVLLLSVLAAGWVLLYADDYARLGRHVAAAAAFVSNFAFWQEASYFDVAADLKPLLHLWSLGVEEQFYLVWPVLLITAARWRRGPLIATFAIGTISFLVAIWTVRIDRTPAFYAPWNRFWELLAGATLACVEADAELDRWRQRLVSTKWWPDLAALIGAVAIISGVWLINQGRVFPGLWVMLPVAGTFVVITAGQRAWINRAILSNPIVVFIGLISYPLYLWHWPLLSFARILSGDVPPVALRMAMLAISVVAAWATYQVVEKPVRFGPRGRIAVPALAVTMSAACAFGFAIYQTDGFMDRPINRIDAARLVAYYEHLRTTQLASPYRAECDFMDWRTSHAKETLDPSCTAAGSAHTIFLWGDSYAQSLSLGLRESAAPGMSVAQVTTSACHAEIDNFDLSVKERRCEKANRYAMDAIRRLRPELVIIAQNANHTITDWPSITRRLLELGAKDVVIVGPFPAWQPGLPRVYGQHHMNDHAEYISEGVDATVFENDRIVAGKVSGLAHVTYLSLLDRLCRQSACLARVPGEDPLDLMSIDFGHLTPKGSSYLGRVIWKPLFASMIR